MTTNLLDRIKLYAANTIAGRISCDKEFMDEIASAFEALTNQCDELMVALAKPASPTSEQSTKPLVERLRYKTCSQTGCFECSLRNEAASELEALQNRLDNAMKREAMLVEVAARDAKAFQQERDSLQKENAELKAEVERLAKFHVEDMKVTNESADYHIKRCAELRTQNAELREALSGMLENYIELKRFSLCIARSDAPNWVGAAMTPEDDIHVIAARQALAAQPE